MGLTSTVADGRLSASRSWFAHRSQSPTIAKWVKRALKPNCSPNRFWTESNSSPATGVMFAHYVYELPPPGQEVEAGDVGEVDVANHAEALEELEVSVDGSQVDCKLVGELLR